MQSFFDEINKEAELKERNKVAPLIEYVVEAYQIVRVSKSQSFVGKGLTRTIIDTITVKNGDFESARKRANGKAKTIGNCMVIEKCERSLSSYYDTETPTNEDME